MLVFDSEIRKDPEIFQQNRLAAHSDHRYYPSLVACEKREDGFRYGLNGLWKFSYAVNVNSAVKGFELPSYDCEGWADIRVPANIQMEGYDAPAYVNVQYPWDGREAICPGQVPERFNPTASYVKYFEVPKAWTGNGQPVYISFQGVESGFALWCNGSYVGYSEDSFTPAEFELTPYLREGRNKLAVQVYKWTAGSWCEDQDFYRFSGIYRDVYLYTVPRVHVWDVKVQTLLKDGFTKADLTVELKAGAVAGMAASEAIGAAGSVKLGLYDGGTLCCQEEGRLGTVAALTLHVDSPRLWSSEDPYLYQLLIEVMDETGTTTEVIPLKVGFRDIRITDSIIYVNGKRVVFHGVNRHEFSSLRGRAVTREETVTDLATMKQNNINAIRTSHYPNSSMLYELCDEYGLYLIDENNMESHGAWDPISRGVAEVSEALPGDRPEFKEMMLDRIRSVYERDKNHASIVIWSVGNESFGGTVPLAMANLFRELDSTRPVHYEGTYWDPRYPETTDIYSRMYPPIEGIEAYLKEHRDKPYICCEYAHAMGNSCGALHKYTEYAYREPLYQGGFIWDYIDQSITKKDRYGKEFQAYGGDFAERPTDYNFSGNGIVYGRGRAVSPKMQEVKYCYQYIRLTVDEQSVLVDNRHLFTDTGVYGCFMTLKKNGVPVLKKELALSVPPLQKQSFPLPIDKQTEPGEYVINLSFCLKEDTLWAKRGHEVAFGETVYCVLPEVQNVEIRWEPCGSFATVCGGAVPRNEGVCQGQQGTLAVTRGNLNIGVRGAEFEALFSCLNGGLVSYRYGGKELIEEIPMPNFWRAPIDNDRGNGMPGRYAQWKLASMYASAKSPDPDRRQKNPYEHNPEIKENDGQVEVTYHYYLPTAPASQCALTYGVRADGTVTVTLAYDPVKELRDMPEFGVIFKFNADYDRVSWYGNGPAETYGDRKSGAKLAIYQNQVKDNLAEYLIPQECGNKTGVRWASVTDARGRGILFTAVGEMNFSALPYTPHELENAKHPYELPPVHYTVVRVSLQQMGIGGDDSWGARTHEEYLLDVSQKMEFKFAFKGV